MSVLRRATELEKRSELLDSLDDVIANTATFLSLSPGWDRVWSNEQGPVLEDLQSLRRLWHADPFPLLLGALGDRTVLGDDGAVDLVAQSPQRLQVLQDRTLLVAPENGSIAERSKEEREWVRSRKQRLDDMTSDLENGSLQPPVFVSLAISSSSSSAAEGWSEGPSAPSPRSPTWWWDTARPPPTRRRAAPAPGPASREAASPAATAVVVASPGRARPRASEPARAGSCWCWLCPPPGPPGPR